MDGCHCPTISCNARNPQKQKKREKNGKYIPSVPRFFAQALPAMLLSFVAAEVTRRRLEPEAGLSGIRLLTSSATGEATGDGIYVVVRLASFLLAGR